MDVSLFHQPVIDRVAYNQISNVDLAKATASRVAQATVKRFDLEHKQFVICVDADNTLELYVDNCLRKRDATSAPVSYVWTNIELNWEEHRYVEARLVKASQELHVTVNRETIFNERLD